MVAKLFHFLMQWEIQTTLEIWTHPTIWIQWGFESQSFWSSDFQLFGFGLVGFSNSYSYGPDHPKTEPLEIRTKCLFWFPMIFDKMAAILFKMEQHHCKTKQRATIWKPNPYGIPAPSVLHNILFSDTATFGRSIARTRFLSLSRRSRCWRTLRTSCASTAWLSRSSPRRRSSTGRDIHPNQIGH